MYKIISLEKEKISDFYKNLSKFYIPEYEIENEEDFTNNINKVIEQYYLIINENEKIIGGFRANSNKISDFFIDLSVNDLETIMESLFDYIKTDDNNEIEVGIKKRFLNLFLKENFKIKFGRYEMLLKFNALQKELFKPRDQSIQIKPYQNVKLEKIANLIYYSYENTPDQQILGYNSEEKVLYMIKELVEGTIPYIKFLENHSFIALKGHKIIGVILLALVNQKPLIFDFVISKQLQRQGIGQRLLSKSLKSLKCQFNELLLTVTLGNKNAESLYKVIGFKQISDTYYVLTKKIE